MNVPESIQFWMHDLCSASKKRSTFRSVDRKKLEFHPTHIPFKIVSSFSAVYSSFNCSPWMFWIKLSRWRAVLTRLWVTSLILKYFCRTTAFRRLLLLRVFACADFCLDQWTAIRTASPNNRMQKFSRFRISPVEVQLEVGCWHKLHRSSRIAVDRSV